MELLKQNFKAFVHKHESQEEVGHATLASGTVGKKTTLSTQNTKK